MQKPKAPLRIKIEIYEKSQNIISGIAKFHENNYKLHIKQSKNNILLKIPFVILGIMHQPHLVRLSGITGTYIEFRPKIDTNSKNIIIESSDIFNEMKHNKEKYNMMEIFVN